MTHDPRQSQRLARPGKIFRPQKVQFAWATVYGGAVTTSDTTFEVDDVILFEGGGGAGEEPLTVKNDPDDFAIANNTTGKIVYCYDSDEEWAWHPLDFPCE